MGSYNHLFAFLIADYRWKWQCSASWERRHCYQNGCEVAIYFFNSIPGKPKVNFQRSSSGLQHGMYLYQQEQVQHQRAVALLELTWQCSDLRNFHSLPPFFCRHTVWSSVMYLPLWFFSSGKSKHRLLHSWNRKDTMGSVQRGKTHLLA